MILVLYNFRIFLVNWSFYYAVALSAPNNAFEHILSDIDITVLVGFFLYLIISH